MPSRLGPSAASAAVCLGDEIQEISDEEQRQMRIELERIKDEDVEKWEVEVEKSSGTRPKTSHSRRKRYKADGTSLESGNPDDTNRSLASSRGSDLAIHHYQDAARGSDPSPRAFQRLELDLDKTRLRTPSATSQSSKRASELYRVTSGTTYTDMESATSGGRSTISARKERLLRLAAERGVGIMPVTDFEEMEHIQEGIESHYNIQGNISQKGERVQGLCLADEWADEMEAEEMEEEFASDFPVPPGMQDQPGLTGLGILGPDMFAQPFGTGQGQQKTKSSGGLSRLIRRRRNSGTSQASGSTTSAPSFTAIGPTPEPWVTSPQVSVAASHRTQQSNQSDTQSRTAASERGSDKTSSKRGALKAFFKGVSGSNAPSSKGIENIARRSDRNGPSGLPPYPAALQPIPILKTSTSLSASRSEGNLPAALKDQTRVPAALVDITAEREASKPSGKQDPSATSVKQTQNLNPDQDRSRNDITPTTARPENDTDNDVPAIPAFPCDLRSLLDVVAHAGVCWIPTDVDASGALGLETGTPALLLLSVRKKRPQSLDLSETSVKAQLVTVHLHLFSYTAADDILDEPGSMNGKRSISYKLKGRDRTELARAQITSSTEMIAILNDGFTIASPYVDGVPAEDGLLTVRFNGSGLHKEWLLQLKTIIAELGACRDGQISAPGSDTTPVAALQAQSAVRPGTASSLSRRNSVPSRPKQRSDLSSERSGMSSVGPNVESLLSSGQSTINGIRDRPQRRSISSIESSTLPSVEKARRQPSVLQQARAEMRAGRSPTPIQPQFTNPALSSADPPPSKIRPTIIIPGSKAPISAPPLQVPKHEPPPNPAQLGLPLASHTRDNRLNPSGNRLSNDSNLASSAGLTPSAGAISPGVLHYIDPANGRTYEIPPGMLEAFLVGSRMVGDGGGLVNPGARGGTVGDGLVPVGALLDQTLSGGRHQFDTRMAYDASTLPTPPSSTKLRANYRFEDNSYDNQSAASVPMSERVRKEFSTSSGVSPSPHLLPTPSPSTTMTSDLADDTRSMGTFGTPSSTGGSSTQYSTESKRRERRGNLRDRMRQMKSQHQAAGKTLDIMAEAETADPWEEPEETILDNAPKRDPVVRFA